MRETKYKQTDIGIIPADWDVLPIKELGVFLKGSISPSALPKTLFHEYSMPAFDEARKPNVVEGSSMKSNRTPISGEVLLINKLNVRQKRIWYVKDASDNAVCSGEFLPFTSNIASLEFLKHLLLTDKIVNEWNDNSSGTSNSQKRVTPAYVLNYMLPIPSFKEQNRIAKVLSDMDALVFSICKLIKKKQDLKTATMQKLLTGKKRLDGFTEPWVERKLGDILSYEQPSNYLVQSSKYVDGGIPVLTAGKTFILGYTNETFGIYNKLPVIIFDDFTTDSRFVTFPFKAKSSAMKMLKANSGYDIRLVYELLQMIDYIPGDHQRHWISMFADFSIMVPSTLEEQTAIASIFSDMDNEISFLEQKRAKYEAIKKGMMQELLTGRIRLV